MNIQHANLENCAEASGTVVVIDVIRAFTTAAFAFAAGVSDIIPVGTVEEALTLRERMAGSLVMGEVGGLPPAGFDFGNSPSALIGLDLHGQRLIQRTGAGTQGLVRSTKADVLLACSFACAGATVRYIKQQSPAQVTLVSTGPDGEDQACAAYLEALLRDKEPDTAALLNQVLTEGHHRLNQFRASGEFSEVLLAQLVADVDCCATLDQFDFAMPVHPWEGLLVMKRVQDNASD